MGTPDADVVTYLAADLAALTAGTNLFRGKERAQRDGKVPHEAVFCLATGGARPDAYLDGNSGTELRYPGVQIMTRSNPDEFGDGQALARAVRTSIHHATIAGWVNVAVAESEPLYIGEDDDGRHTWTTNLEMMNEE